MLQSRKCKRCLAVYLEHTATSVPTAGTPKMPYTIGAAGPSVVAMSVLVAWVSVHDILKETTRSKEVWTVPQQSRLL